MIKFLKTTWKLWMDVPGKPPFWKCAVVSWFVSTAPRTSITGSIVLDEHLEWAIEEEEQRRTHA